MDWCRTREPATRRCFFRAETLVESATLPHIALEETIHYQITRGILDRLERYWKHLRTEAD